MKKNYKKNALSELSYYLHISDYQDNSAYKEIVERIGSNNDVLRFLEREERIYEQGLISINEDAFDFMMNFMLFNLDDKYKDKLLLSQLHYVCNSKLNNKLVKTELKNIERRIKLFNDENYDINDIYTLTLIRNFLTSYTTNDYRKTIIFNNKVIKEDEKLIRTDRVKVFKKTFNEKKLDYEKMNISKYLKTN